MLWLWREVLNPGLKMTEGTQNILVLVLLFGGLLFWPAFRLFCPSQKLRIQKLRLIFLIQLAVYITLGFIMALLFLSGHPDWGVLIFFAYWAGQFSILASLLIIVLVRKKQKKGNSAS